MIGVRTTRSVTVHSAAVRAAAALLATVAKDVPKLTAYTGRGPR